MGAVGRPRWTGTGEETSDPSATACVGPTQACGGVPSVTDSAMPLQPLDPRTARSRASMLAAATTLLHTGGMAAVTHQAVAQAAGVGRATVYRHWARPIDLLLATLESARAGALEFGAGPIREEIYANFLSRITWFNQQVSSTVIGALVSGAEHDAQIAKIRDGIFRTATANMQAAIMAAVGRGELRAATPAHTIATMIVGAVLFERHMLGQTITPEMLRGIVDAGLTPWMPEPTSIGA